MGSLKRSPLQKNHVHVSQLQNTVKKTTVRKPLTNSIKEAANRCLLTLFQIFATL